MANKSHLKAKKNKRLSLQQHEIHNYRHNIMAISYTCIYINTSYVVKISKTLLP